MLVRSIILIKIVVYMLSVSFFLQCRTQEDSRFFDHCKIAEPVCPNEDIKFWLYTSSTQDDPRELSTNDTETTNQGTFVEAPVIILVHGYTGHRDYSPNTEIRPALFQHAEYNVISIDYNPLALSPCYVSAVQNLKVVANCTAQLIDHLVDARMASLEAFHPIGFSLGAHMVGMIGNFLKSGKLARVTALDPARPLFISAPSEDRISSDDADFVDVIHTDILGRGLLLPTGHVDFFMNGGFMQPGCESQTDTTVGSCNHVRAPIYFAESINSTKGFWGYKCPHWYAYLMGICRRDHNYTALMGMHTPSDTRGLYFVNTNNEPPYAKGKDNRIDQEDD